MTQEEPINPTAQDITPDAATQQETSAPTDQPVMETVHSPVEDAAAPGTPVVTETVIHPATPSDIAVVSPMEASAQETPMTSSPESTPAETSASPRREKQQRQKLSPEEFAVVWEELTKAKDAETVLTLKCMKSIRGGALVDFRGLEGFIPMSHIDLTKNPTEKNVEPLVGQMVDVVVIEMSSPEERRYVCSRKSALKKTKFDSLKKGMVLEGTVTTITDYGVFVDLGGIDGLVHISRLSKVRVNHPSDVVKQRQHVKVTVVDVDHKKERIALSMKEFAESPWLKVAEKYPVGSLHKGRVRNITTFGVYVQLEPGIDGMVHISDLSWTKRLATPEEVVKIGEEVEVKVLEVNPEKQRIALSVRETQNDPWPRLANIYPVGTESEAKIKQLMPAGAVVELPFDVDAFVPRGKMGMKGKRGKKESGYAVGDVVQVKIVDIDVEGRSLICGIQRDERASEPRTEKQKQEMKQSASDRAFTLGEIAGLREMFAAQQGDSKQEAAGQDTAAESALAGPEPHAPVAPSTPGEAVAEEAPAVQSVEPPVEPAMITGLTDGGSMQPEITDLPTKENSEEISSHGESVGD